jgi:hypothetical protein
MEHTHKPQTLENGTTLYVCTCGARQQKSQIINGVKTEVWKTYSKEEEAARLHKIELVLNEGYVR